MCLAGLGKMSSSFTGWSLGGVCWSDRTVDCHRAH